MKQTARWFRYTQEEWQSYGAAKHRDGYAFASPDGRHVLVLQYLEITRWPEGTFGEWKDVPVEDAP